MDREKLLKEVLDLEEFLRTNSPEDDTDDFVFVLDDFVETMKELLEEE